MSSVSNNVVITLLYEDDSTRKYTFENVSSEDAAAVKAKILKINANANDEYANFYQTFVSDDGAAVLRIDDAKIVSIEEEIIYGS